MACGPEFRCECCGLPCNECRVLVEFRTLKKPGGAEELRRQYGEQLKARQAELEQRLTTGDVYKKLTHAGFEFQIVSSLKNEKATAPLEFARRFLQEQFAKFLLLLGAKGIGKTYAAAYVAQEFAREYPWNQSSTGQEIHEPLLCVRASKLTAVSAYGEMDKQWVRQLERANLLVVDDMGDEGTDFGRGRLVDLLLERYSRGRRTVITSNLTGESFKRRYGEALSDRIRGDGLVHEGKGASMRGRYDKGAA